MQLAIALRLTLTSIMNTKAPLREMTIVLHWYKCTTKSSHHIAASHAVLPLPSLLAVSSTVVINFEFEENVSGATSALEDMLLRAGAVSTILITPENHSKYYQLLYFPWIEEIDDRILVGSTSVHGLIVSLVLLSLNKSLSLCVPSRYRILKLVMIQP